MYIPQINVQNVPLAIALEHDLGFNFTSPIVCVGGKSKQVQYLTKLMPAQMEHFYEPFGGGLSTTYFLIHSGRVKSANCHVGDLDCQRRSKKGPLGGAIVVHFS